MKIVLFVLGAILAACTQPVKPTPRADAFTGGTFDCALPIVAEQRQHADGIVGDCLVTSDKFKCIDALAPFYEVDTVACSVRALGMATFEKIANGTATTRDNLIAIGSKEWIKAEGVGYR